jgi:hypothetical protein
LSERTYGGQRSGSRGEKRNQAVTTSDEQ